MSESKAPGTPTRTRKKRRRNRSLKDRQHRERIQSNKADYAAEIASTESHYPVNLHGKVRKGVNLSGKEQFSRLSL